MLTLTILYRKLIHRLLTIIVTITLAMTGRAGTIGEGSMVNLMPADGLSGETVNKVLTDHGGYVWIATNGGVTVYDGTNLTSLRIEGEQGQLLGVFDICETSGCRMWAATEEGLFLLKHGSPRFERVLPEVQNPRSLLAVGDTIYVGSQQGLQYYDGNELHHIDVDVSHHGLDNVVRQYVKGDDGQIWFLGRYDLNSFDPKSGKITGRYPVFSNQQYGLTQFAYAGNGRFVVGTRAYGLYVCDVKAGTTERIEGIGRVVNSVMRSADGCICVATDGAGAYLLEVGEEKVKVKKHFSTDGDGLHCLPTNATYCYYRDANGIDWFGFVRYGMAYSYYSGNMFMPFRVGDFTSEGINVRSLCRHGNEMIIGTQTGFYDVNLTTGHHRFFSPDDMGDAHIVNTVAWYEDRFYIGTFDGGLKVYDPATQTLVQQSFSPLLDESSIGDLKVGPDGRLWIGFTHGLIIVDEGKVWQHFTEQNSRIVGGLILSITFDRSGNAWLTGSEGCSLYSMRSHAIVETTFPKGFFNKQRWMRGAQGHDGLVFMRTGPQTFYTNEQMTEFGELELPMTFPDKWCRSFVDDMRGHYLVASNRGVLCCSYDMKDTSLFGYGDGLHGDFINDMVLDDDGVLWVATSQGLYTSTVKDMEARQNNKDYRVILYDIRRDGERLTPDDEYMVGETHHIRITGNFTSEVLRMCPLLLDFSKHQGRLFEYRLDDDEWRQIDANEDIELRHLMLGTHQLEVRLAGALGTMSAYTITVVPSFWAFFELVLLLVALLLLWLWWRFRKNTKVLLSERDEIEDALVEIEQELQKEEERDEPKYERVRIDEAECADIVQRMKTYIEKNKVYTNVDLKMKDLADVLHLSPSKLSQVFNLYLKENYYDFINRYRLEEFKRLIAAGENKRYTITALSERCGFKKSSFFSTFRKIEGMTPVEYLKKNGIKA